MVTLWIILTFTYTLALAAFFGAIAPSHHDREDLDA